VVRIELIFSILLAATVVAVVPIQAARSEPPVSDDSAQHKERVAKLIRELGDNSRSIRNEARRQLVVLGPAILPLLPAPEELPNASVREAVRDVRLNLEKTKARESVKASHVTLPGETTLEGFLEIVKQQTQNEFDVSAVPPTLMKQPLRFDAGRSTFWEAMDQATKQVGLTYSGDSRTRQLKLEPRNENGDRAASLVDYDGVFRISAAPARLRPIFGDDAHRLVRIEIEVLTEPRLRPLFLQYAAGDIVAVGPGKQPLESFNPRASYELPLENGRHGVTARVDFRAPASVDLKHIGVRGNMKMQTAAGSEMFRFRDLRTSQGTARRRGGVVATLQRVDFTANGDKPLAADISIAVAYETGGPAFESHRTWIFHNESYLEAADGNRIDPQSDYNTLLQADGAVAVEYRFEGLTGSAEDYQFVYVAPTLMINVPVEIDLPRIRVAPPKSE
jgi:hypothetical protein